MQSKLLDIGFGTGTELMAKGLIKEIKEFARVVGAAVAGLAVCLPMLLEARPRTPLRVFCIAAFEFLGRLQGSTLKRGRRVAMAYACDFGSLRDAYYDEQKLDVIEYRALRSALRRMAPEEATFRYIRELRNAERGRPVLSVGPGVANAIVGYRAAVIEISLRWMQEISGVAVGRVQFQSLVSLVCLMQLADDLLDWRDDQARSCPSYVTARLLEQPRVGIGAALRGQADALLQRTADAGWQSAGALPFTVVGVATWAFVVALLKVRLLGCHWK